MKCKSCGQEISKGASYCQHCGKDQRSFFGKHKILTGVSVAVILFIIFVKAVASKCVTYSNSKAANSTTKNSTDTKKAASTSAPKATSIPKATSATTAPTKAKETPTPAPTKASAPKSFKIGDVVAVGDLNLSVTKLERSNGTDFDKPKDGNEFIIVYVKIQNKGKNKLSYNPYYFSLQNSKGQITNETFTIVDNNTMLDSGDLAPGGEVEGSIAFQSPAGDTGLILQYQDNTFSSNSKASINLQ